MVLGYNKYRTHARSEVSQNYIHLYHKYAKQCQLFQKVKEFENNYTTMTLHEVQTEYEILDDLRCKVTAAAELSAENSEKVMLPSLPN